MNASVLFSKKIFTLASMMAMASITLVFAPAAKAGNYFNLDFETAPSGTPLDAFKLDSNSGQTIDGVTYGTKSSFASVGEIWASLGINIMGYDNSYVADYHKPNKTPNSGGRVLGLFQSNCLPSDHGPYDGANGTSIEGFTTPCAINTASGDNDLATGTYLDEDGVQLYSSNPLGNLLIFEERSGNNRPDDTAGGGTFVFDFSKFSGSWLIEEISVVDDADGRITYFYDDMTTSDEIIDIDSNPTPNPSSLQAGENEVRFFNSAQEKKITKVAVQFNNSGGIGGIRLKQIKPVTIPEPAAMAGLVMVGAGIVAGRRKKSQQA